MTAFELLARLAGRWTGRGAGRYPTIDDFEYEEETSLVAAPEYPLLRFEQRTWVLPDREPSHCELGIWRVLEDGEVELANVQGSGRVEVLRGRAEALGADGLRLELRSAVLGNDERMVSSERAYTLEGDRLHYAAFMATTTTPEPTRLQHLEATLRRADAEGDSR